MTDIVERLRDRYATHPMVMEAAAEIERLTGLLAEWENHAGPYKDAEVERLKAENAEQKAELQKLYSVLTINPQARAALEPKP